MPPMLPPHVSPQPPLGFCTPASYSPYVPMAPSRYAFNAALNPPYAFCHPPTPLCRLPSLCSCSALLLCLRHRLLSLRLCSALPQCLRHRSCCALPTCLQHCPHTSLILNATYHPYSLAEPSR
ncbi:hypothetical protein O181_005594 [Austropuccinia psidii MF-1]|uniref:Uncharacterized protein n=1 Tax=Austropuccinia psidii MF-1 TaxID=1389203 RepID=A0A9Q3GG14_9BASI|nr:hypothetical protein [Austropuccinia psidii MF-1]